MEVTLALMASESTNHILGVLGFLLLLPVLVFVVALVGRRIVEKHQAQEFTHEVETGDDDWLKRTIGGDNPAK